MLLQRLPDFRIGLLALLLLAHAQLVLAQAPAQLEGSILDSLGQPLPGAHIVCRHLADQRLAGFAHADAEGRFSLSLPPGTLLVKASMVGYVDRLDTLSLRAGDKKRLRLVLSEQAQRLSEVTVAAKAPPIAQQGDTVVFNAESYATAGDLKAADILRKLPGVEVRGDGGIYYQGKRVRDLLIEGESLFQSSPETLSKAFPAHAIDKIQLFDSSNGAGYGGEPDWSINLTIKEDKKNVVFGDVLAGAGAGSSSGHRPYRAKSDLFWIRSKVKAFWLAEANSTGDQVLSLQQYLQFVGGISGMRKSELGFLPISGAELSRPPLNRNGFSALSVVYRPSEQVRAQGYALLYRQESQPRSALSRQYPGTGLGFSSAEQLRQERRLLVLGQQLQYTPGLRHTLRLQLYGSLALSSAEAQADNRFGSEASRNTLASEQRGGTAEASAEHLYSGDRGSWLSKALVRRLPQRADAQLGSSLGVFGWPGWPQAAQLQQAEEGADTEASASVRRRHDWGKKVTWKGTLGYEQFRGRRSFGWEGHAEPLPDSLDLRYAYRRDAYYLSSLFEVRHGIFFWEVGGRLADYRLAFEGASNRLLLDGALRLRAEPYATARVHLPGSQTLTLSYRSGNQYAEADDLNQAYRLSDVQRLSSGMLATRLMPTHRWGLQYGLNNLYARLFASLMASYERLPFALSAEQEIGLASISRRLQLPQESWRLFAGISKTFDGERPSTLKLQANLQRQEGANRINGLENRFRNGLQDWQAAYFTHGQQALNIGLTWNYQRLRYQSERLATRSHTHQALLRLDWEARKGFLLQLQPDAMALRQAGEGWQGFLFVHAQARLQLAPKWQARLQAFNLLNRKEIALLSIAPAYEQRQAQAALGRQVLLALQYSF